MAVPGSQQEKSAQAALVLSVIRELVIEGTCAPVALAIYRDHILIGNAPPKVMNEVIKSLENDYQARIADGGLYITL